MIYLNRNKENLDTELSKIERENEIKFQKEMIRAAKSKLGENDEDQVFDPYTCFQNEPAEEDEFLENPNKVRKLCVCLARGEYTICLLLNLVQSGPSGEFDPFYIERIKSTILLFYDQEFSNSFSADFFS